MTVLGVGSASQVTNNEDNISNADTDTAHSANDCAVLWQASALRPGCSEFVTARRTLCVGACGLPDHPTLADSRMTRRGSSRILGLLFTADLLGLMARDSDTVF